MIRRIILSLMVLLISRPVWAADLTVAVAANVQYAMQELQTAFTQQTGITVQTTTGSSGKLTAQIDNGAPFDVFLSANMMYPQHLFDSGLAVTAPRVYAYGALVLWTTRDLDIHDGVKALTGPGVTAVALPNPQSAPYGAQAVNCLKYYGLYDALEPRLVYGENISQTNQYIVSGVADAGFTAKSVVFSPEMRAMGQWQEIPADAYQPIEQGVVILRFGRDTHGPAAQAFYDFLFTEPARAILERFGYAVPPEARPSEAP